MSRDDALNEEGRRIGGVKVTHRDGDGAAIAPGIAYRRNGWAHPVGAAYLHARAELPLKLDVAPHDRLHGGQLLSKCGRYLPWRASEIGVAKAGIGHIHQQLLVEFG